MSELVLLLLLILLQQPVEIQARKNPITLSPSSTGAFVFPLLMAPYPHGSVYPFTCQLQLSVTRTGCATCATCLILFARIVPAGSATSVIVHPSYFQYDLICLGSLSESSNQKD